MGRKDRSRCLRKAHARTAYRGTFEDEPRERVGGERAGHFALTEYNVIGSDELRSNAAPASTPAFAISSAVLRRG